ncbi:MAG: hypothetical protein AVDCRST_MAG22-1106, partial [uncultured Rubrobacteraceae bacterium]
CQKPRTTFLVRWPSSSRGS